MNERRIIECQRKRCANIRNAERRFCIDQEAAHFLSKLGYEGK